MESAKRKRNRKKLFPYTVVIKISESSYDGVLTFSKEFKLTKSESFREIIDLGIKNIKKP